MKIFLKKLNKTPGYSRKKHIINMRGGNYIKICNDNKKNLPTHSWLLGKNSIAVIKSLLKDQEFVVKIEKIGNFRKKQINTINNEVNWHKKLSGRTNFLKFICNFLCNDKIEKYNKNIKNKSICDGNEEVSIIIIEYIDGDTIANSKILSKLNNLQLKSFIKRLYYCLIQAYLDLDYLHNDLTDGVNIMIRKTNDDIQKYNINGNKYNIKTYGFEPIIIDYGRSDKAFKIDKNLIEDLNILDQSIRLGLSNNLNFNIYSDITKNINKRIKLNELLILLEKW